MGSCHSFKRDKSYMETIENASYISWKRIVSEMFSDDVYNKGRLYVLKLFTEDMVKSLAIKGEMEEAYKIQHDYKKFVK